MSESRIYALTVHARYACRHSHACCTAGWSIPVEPAKVDLLGGAWLLPAQDGACPELDRSAGRCRVHRDHGEHLLPDSCFHFPRRALLDDRGTFVTLSHFCPTAATLLLDDDQPFAIVDNPPSFPPERSYEGLDARGDWPPMLRRDALFDFDSFWLWERFLVATCNAPPGDVDTTLAHIALVAERLRGWRITDGSLAEWTARVLDAARQRSAAGLSREAHDAVEARFARRVDDADTYRAIVSSVPAGLAAPELPPQLSALHARWVAPVWRDLSRSVLRYLGAKAFAAWTPYQSRGIRTHVAELYAAAAVLRVECARACAGERRLLDRTLLHEAVRMSDWLLMHLADRDRLMEWLGRVEDDHG